MCLTDQVQQKLETNNVFLIARRQVDVGGLNQELMYMSLKFINNIWVLIEVKAAPGSATVGVREHLLILLSLCILCGYVTVFCSLPSRHRPWM